MLRRIVAAQEAERQRLAAEEAERLAAKEGTTAEEESGFRPLHEVLAHREVVGTAVLTSKLEEAQELTPLAIVGEGAGIA